MPATAHHTRDAIDALPTTMRAAAIDRFGGPEVLTIHTLPVPTVTAREVLIALDTAGVGVWDAEARAGPADGHTKFPLVLGSDGAGTVVAVGSGVQRLKVGDRVYAYSYGNPKGGFYAQYVAVAASHVAPLPHGVDLEHAGAVGTTGLTALQGVDDALRLKSGDTVIVHGAAGGVGSLALQFAKLRGARVLATATRDDGLAFVSRLGADATVDGQHGDIIAAARQFAPDGVDALLAFAGGAALQKCLDAVRSGGRAAYPNGVEPAPARRHGINIIPYDAVANVRHFESLNRALGAGSVRIEIAAAFPLAEAAAAHRRLAQGHVPGKIVLRSGLARADDRQ